MAKRPDTAWAFGGVFGGLLLLLSLAALLLGVFGAVYLDRYTTWPVQTADQPTAGKAGTPLGPAPVSQPAPAVESPHDVNEPISPDVARALDAIQPSAGPRDASSSPPQSASERPAAPTTAAPAGVEAETPEPQAPEARPAEPAAEAAPAEAVASPSLSGSPVATAESAPVPPPAATPGSPPNPVSAPAFRVEYAAYAASHPVYAEHLVQSLARLGIDAAVDRARGVNGRSLYRVSSAAADAHAARRAADDARRKLHLKPLIRRNGPEAVPLTAGRASAGLPVLGARYWVQFGAFDQPRQAERLRRHLAQHGIAAAIAPGRHPSGRPAFYLRTTNLADRHSAAPVAQEARILLGYEPLIGRMAKAHIVSSHKHGERRTTPAAP